MTAKERLAEMFGIWLAVYPAVLLLSNAFEWLGIDWALWIELAVSTAITVPIISFVAVPRVRGAMAAAEGTTPAELARREADRAERKDGACAPGE